MKACLPIFFNFLDKLNVLRKLMEEVRLTVNQAVAERIKVLLKEKGFTQYRLEKNSGIQHGSMNCIMKDRNKTVTLSTIMMLAHGFGITAAEFIDDLLFAWDSLEVE